MRDRRTTIWVGLVTALLAGVLAGCTSTGFSAACTSGHSGNSGAAATSHAVETAPRLWVEATLDAIRRDFPAPTVHARNLWHLSAVMWDAWATYTPNATPYFDVDVAPAIPDSEAERLAAINDAINFGAHRLLLARYEFAIGGIESTKEMDELLRSACTVPPDGEDDPDAASSIGIAIADRAIELGFDDGSFEINRYVDLSYQPVNEPLVVAGDEIEMVDPNRWQPLQLSERVTQNGLAQGPGVQVFIGSNWGSVTSFALPEPDERGVTIDPGPPPLLGGATSDAFRQAAVDVVGYADLIGGESGDSQIDISPGSLDQIAAQTAHPLNPATGEPYDPNIVRYGDYARAVAEFWADGPDSETPPGHWNTLAIAASDGLDQQDLMWGGDGSTLGRLEWDLRLFFTLNASLHDAAIAVWGAKRAYDYARPISMIRHLGSGRDNGLPLTPGLVEQVTDESAADGGRHAGLSVGEIVVRSWLGPVENPETQVAGVGWRPAIEWLPYQRPTFVSPAFAGYTSGHSGFSRAAADVLTRATGSEFFPGGLFTHAIEAGSFLHEEGPTADIELQWATFGDAADQAGESRRYGGIHVEADDLAGRRMGADVADLAWQKAQSYFGG